MNKFDVSIPGLVQKLNWEIFDLQKQREYEYHECDCEHCDIEPELSDKELAELEKDISEKIKESNRLIRYAEEHGVPYKEVKAKP